MPPAGRDLTGAPGFGGHAMYMSWARCQNVAVALVVTLPIAACSHTPTVAETKILPPPLQQARIWVYRSATGAAAPGAVLAPTVRFNGTPVGAAADGSAFFRDVEPGAYHVDVQSTYADLSQSSNIALGAGEVAYVRIEDLDNWANGMGRMETTFYARDVPLEAGRAEVPKLKFAGGSDFAGAPQ
jgi:hypothetical protein